MTQSTSLDSNESPIDVHHLADRFLSAGQAAQAEQLCRQILAHHPLPSLQHRLGIALLLQGRAKEALVPLEQAARAHPSIKSFWADLAIAAKQAEVRELEEVALTHLCALPHVTAQDWMALGAARHECRRPRDAAAAFAQARALDPDLAEAEFNQAYALLGCGDLAAGWPLYEARLRRQDARDTPSPASPRWQRRAPPQRLLVLREQGLGDTLQFARYLPLLTALGHQVIFQVQAPLLTLLRRALPSVEVIESQRGEFPDHDSHIPLLSLPGAFGSTLETLPPPLPSLRPDGTKTEVWRARLATFAPVGLRIGLVWRGNPRHPEDRKRSAPASALAPLSQRPDLRLFGLQPHLPYEDRALVKDWGNYTDLGPRLTDFDETAAIMASLDLILSVDSAPAHLAASLGRPTGLLLPYAAEWRWLTEGSGCPWYPAARLFRQTTRGDWASVIAQVLHNLPPKRP